MISLIFDLLPKLTYIILTSLVIFSVFVVVKTNFLYGNLCWMVSFRLWKISFCVYIALVVCGSVTANICNKSSSVQYLIVCDTCPGKIVSVFILVSLNVVIFQHYFWFDLIYGNLYGIGFFLHIDKIDWQIGFFLGRWWWFVIVHRLLVGLMDFRHTKFLFVDGLSKDKSMQCFFVGAFIKCHSNNSFLVGHIDFIDDVV